MSEDTMTMDDTETTSLELVAVNDGIALGDHFKMTTRGLTIKGKPSFEQKAHLGELFNVLEQALPLAIGDFMNHVEATEGEKSSQILDAESGYAEGSRRNFAWVAGRVPEENRMIPPLTFAHLQVVAKLTPKQQHEWLEKAITGDGTNEWSAAKLKTELLATEEGGKSKLRFYLVIDCGTEAKQEKLAEQLEAGGYTVVKRSGINRVQKRAKSHGKPAKKARRGEVTAKRRRASKMSSRRRLKA